MYSKKLFPTEMNILDAHKHALFRIEKMKNKFSLFFLEKTISCENIPPKFFRELQVLNFGKIKKRWQGSDTKISQKKN